MTLKMIAKGFSWIGFYSEAVASADVIRVNRIYHQGEEIVKGNHGILLFLFLLCFLLCVERFNPEKLNPLNSSVNNDFT